MIGFKKSHDLPIGQTFFSIDTGRLDFIHNSSLFGALILFFSKITSTDL